MDSSSIFVDADLPPDATVAAIRRLAARFNQLDDVFETSVRLWHEIRGNIHRQATFLLVQHHLYSLSVHLNPWLGHYFVLALQLNEAKVSGLLKPPCLYDLVAQQVTPENAALYERFFKLDRATATLIDKALLVAREGFSMPKFYALLEGDTDNPSDQRPDHAANQDHLTMFVQLYGEYVDPQRLLSVQTQFRLGLLHQMVRKKVGRIEGRKRLEKGKESESTDTTPDPSLAEMYTLLQPLCKGTQHNMVTVNSVHTIICDLQEEEHQAYLLFEFVQSWLQNLNDMGTEMKLLHLLISSLARKGVINAGNYDRYKFLFNDFLPFVAVPEAKLIYEMDLVHG